MTVMARGAYVEANLFGFCYHGAEKPAFPPVSWELPAGSSALIVGPSGCGKTTTLKMINRLTKQLKGQFEHVQGAGLRWKFTFSCKFQNMK